MKIYKTLTSTFAISVLSAFLTGCRVAGSYVDDVTQIGDDAANVA